MPDDGGAESRRALMKDRRRVWLKEREIQDEMTSQINEHASIPSTGVDGEERRAGVSPLGGGSCSSTSAPGTTKTTDVTDVTSLMSKLLRGQTFPSLLRKLFLQDFFKKLSSGEGRFI